MVQYLCIVESDDVDVMNESCGRLLVCLSV